MHRCGVARVRVSTRASAGVGVGSRGASVRHYRGKGQHNGQCGGRCNLCASHCEAARVLRQASRHRQHQLTCPQSHPTPSPRVTEHGLCLSNTFETLRSLDQVFVLPTARRQVIRDTSIRVGSIKQGFSDLSFSGTPTVMLYPFARSMDCDFRTPSRLCAVSTKSSSFPLQGGK